MQKTIVCRPSRVSLLLAAFSHWMHAAMEKIAPVGYQDEAGFHLGVQRGK